MLGVATFVPALEPMYGMPAATRARMASSRSRSYSAFSRAERVAAADEEGFGALDVAALADLRDVESHAAEALADTSGVAVVIMLRERHERHRAHAGEHAAELRLGVIEKAVAVDD